MKALFKNNVSIKDFFANHRGQGGAVRVEGNISDSAIDNSSQSQFPYSQIEFPDTQDYSQNAQLSCSQPSTETQSPRIKFGQKTEGKRFSAIEVKARAGSFSSIKAATASYQQQLQNNKAKAKERDERDAINSMLVSVRECTSDIQVAVHAVKENVQEGVASSENKLTQALEHIESQLRRHTSNIQSALEVKSDVTQKMSSLETMVSKKDHQIDALQDEIKSLKDQNQQKMIEELQKVYLDCQENTTDNLQQMYNGHQHELGKLAKLIDRHHKDLSNKTQDYQEVLLKDQAESLQDLYGKLVNEVNNSLTEMTRGLEAEITKKLRTICQENFHQMQSFVTCQGDAKNELKDQVTILTETQQQLNDLQQQQLQQLQDMLSQKMEELGRVQRHCLEDVSEKLCQNTKEKVAKKAAEEKHQEKLQDAQKRYDELDALKDRYQKEVAHLLSEKTNLPEASNFQATTRDRVNPPKSFRPILSCFSPRMLTEGTEQSSSSAQPFNNFTIDTFVPKKLLSKDVNYGKQVQKSVTETTNASSIQRSENELPTNGEPSTSRFSGVKFGQTLSGNKSAQSGLFISPHLRNRNWTSKSLFSKNRHESPIATVVPLVRKEAAEKRDQQPVADNESSNETQSSKQKAPNKKKRRRKSSWHTKKKKRSTRQGSDSVVETAVEVSQTQNQSCSDEDEETQYVAPQSESIFGQAAVSSTSSSRKKDIGVYDFHEESTWTTDVFRKPNQQNKVQTSYRNRIMKSYKDVQQVGHKTAEILERREDSSQDDICSIGSSPSLSITEVVIRRKIKKEKTSPVSGKDLGGKIWQSDISNKERRQHSLMKLFDTERPLQLKRPKRVARLQ